MAEKQYKNVKIINSQEELEQYKIKAPRLAWRSSTDDFREYTVAKKIATERFSRLCGLFQLKQISISEGQAFKNPKLKELRNKELESPSLNAQWDKSKINNESFFSNLEKIQNAILTDEKFDLDEIEESVNIIFQHLNSFNVNTEAQQLFIDNSQTNQYLINDALNLKNDYHSYEIVEGGVYTNFFEEQNIVRNSYCQLSEENPQDYLLKINCDINLPNGAVLDAFCNVEAQNITGGFLGIAGNLKANDIICDKLYANNLECNNIKSYNSGIVYQSLVDELTNEVSMYESFENIDPNIEDNHLEDNQFNNIIIGTFVYDEIAKELDEIIKAEGDNVSNYAIGKKHGLDVFLYPNAYFKGGQINASKVSTDNLICGSLNTEGLICKNAVIGDSVIDKKETLNSKLHYDSIEVEEEFEDSLDHYEFEFYQAFPKWKLKYGDAKIDNIVCDNIVCKNLDANSLLSNNYVKVEGNLSARLISVKESFVKENITANYINANSITAKNIDVDTLKTNRLSTDTLNLNSYIIFTNSELIDVNQINIPRSTLEANIEINDLNTVKNIIEDKNNLEMGKAKPKHTPSFNLDKGIEK